jgi:hypothetical protein
MSRKGIGATSETAREPARPHQPGQADFNAILPRFGAKLIGQRHGAKNVTVASDQYDSFARAIVAADFGKRIRRNRHAMFFK